MNSSENDQTRLPNEGPKSSLLSTGQSFGQYKVIRLLGRGGMGEVYEVEHAVLHRRYALKVIRAEVLSRPSAVERFRREAQVMNHLEHPNIVQVDDFDETDGHSWLRMSLVEGAPVDEEAVGCSGLGGRKISSLDDLLSGKPLPEPLIVDLISQILDGLAYAHSKGAIHRDIKPSNILLQPSSQKPNGLQAKIADFGLVQMVGEDWLQSQVQLTVARSMAQPADPDATRLDDEGRMADGGFTHSAGSGQVGTSTQALLGTYAYMSPEQKKGSQVDARSDLYAVALIAFQMLTGEASLGMETPGELVDGLDPAWDGWIKRGIATRLERRFQDAGQMLHKLPSYSAGTKSQVARAPSQEVEAQDSLKVEPEELPEADSAVPADSGKDFELKFGESSLKMKQIAPGKFMMGTPKGDEWRYDDEIQHEVSLSQSYWLGATQITQAQWQTIMGDNPSHFIGADLPVEKVSWEDAMEFCQKLTEGECRAGRLPSGYAYTLPTEAQWEYACRAGTSGAYAGDLDAMGWYNANSENKTHPVGQKRPNPWGLYDMHGNVWEWCLDWYGDYPSESVVDPRGASSGSDRVLRGGGWNSLARSCRSANCSRNAPGYRNNFLGFRLALTPSLRD